MKIKVATWNLAWFGQLLQGRTRTLPQNSKKVDDAAGKAIQERERLQIAEEIRLMDPDILCIEEGPSTGKVKLLRDYCSKYLNGTYMVVERGAADTTGYQISGAQGIWFLVKTGRLGFLNPTLLPIPSWRKATLYEAGAEDHTYSPDGKKWTIVHPSFKATAPDEDDGEGDPPVDLGNRQHAHYRHPQTLVCTIAGKRVDFIGLHLKSKRISDELNRAGALRQKPPEELTADEKTLIKKAEQMAVEARIKLTTECVDIRYYIENRFRNEPHPAIFVLGDLNDGVGKEYFERHHMFHDLISNLQGDVFFARRFLNHALFDYMADAGEDYRWTVQFKDPWDPKRDPRILLDHILFTQSVVGEKAFERTGLRVPAHAGKVEHAAHVAANSAFSGDVGETSDHRPVSVEIDVEDAFA